MYVTPELTRIGDARDVVLGITDIGLDLDTTMIISGMENEAEYAFPDEVSRAW